MTTSISKTASAGAGLARYRELISEWFGYPDLRPAQARALSALERNDVFIVSPTGSGKSMSYVLPALRNGRALVVSPHIALMQDQVESLQANGVAAAFINSTLTNVEKRDTYLRFRNGDIRLLYTSPESLGNQRFVKGLRSISLNLLAIDEAHCVSEWGHTFRPDYLRLREVREALGSPRTLALTATATPVARDDIVRRLGLDSAEQIINSVARDNLRFSVQEAVSNEQKLGLLQQFVQSRRARSGIVYAGSRKRTEELAGLLADSGVKAAAYHAGLDAATRRATQRAFMTDEIDVIVATSAFGLGVDKPDIRFVVHFDMPGRLESYYQEAGRAGRDGEPAECELIYTRWSRRAPEFFISQDHPDDRQVRKFWHELLARSGDGGPGYGLAGGAREANDGAVMSVRALQDSGLVGANGATLLSADPDAEIRTGTITAHMRHELEMLDRMVGFATTAECRMDVVLRYFGEAGDIQCGRCDNCLSAKWERVSGRNGAGRAHRPAGRQSPVEPVRQQDPDRPLFDELRAWRKRRADADRVPAFVVFADRVLIQLARSKPGDMSALTAVPGIGAVKRDRYGREVLRVIAGYVDGNGQR